MIRLRVRGRIRARIRGQAVYRFNEFSVRIVGRSHTTAPNINATIGYKQTDNPID